MRKCYNVWNIRVTMKLAAHYERISNLLEQVQHTQIVDKTNINTNFEDWIQNIVQNGRKERPKI